MSEDIIERLQYLAQTEQTREQARELCLKTLRDEPSAHRVRLWLAKLYYLDRMLEFSIRELLYLRGLIGGHDSLDALLDSISKKSARYASMVAKEMGRAQGEFSDEREVAELDFESEFADALENSEEE